MLGADCKETALIPFTSILPPVDKPLAPAKSDTEESLVSPTVITAELCPARISMLPERPANASPVVN